MTKKGARNPINLALSPSKEALRRPNPQKSKKALNVCKKHSFFFCITSVCTIKDVMQNGNYKMK